MNRILITGGAGFIGSHLAEALIAEGQAVTVIDDLSTGALANLASLRRHPNFRFIRASIRDAKALARALESVGFVYHLAAAVGVELIVKSPVYTIEDNVRGTEDVLAAAASAGCGVLITSTSEVYGKSARSRFREDDDLLIGPPTLGRWSYACSKLLDEFLGLAYYHEKHTPVTIVRLFNTVGQRQSGRYGMVLPRFVQSAIRGKPITIYGDGQQSRCFCHVSDVVRALVALPKQPQAVGQVYNIGSTEEVTIQELAKRVRSLCSNRSKLRYMPYAEAYEKGFEDMRRRVPSTVKIRQLIGWRPSKNLDEILQLVIAEQHAGKGL